MAEVQVKRTRVLKVKYYLTLVGEAEIEIVEGEHEDEAIRAFLPDVPAHCFNVISADFAEVEDDNGGKRCIALNETEYRGSSRPTNGT